MKSIITIRRVVPVVVVLALAVPLIGQQPPKDKPGPDERTAKEKAGKPFEAGPLDAHFTDDSHLKVKLRDEKIELVTPYGKLVIPVADVRRIEFATRVPDDVAKKVEAAVANLGKEDFKTREAASAELLALGIPSYPALLRAAKSPDAEIARRADELLAQLREQFSEERLEVRPDDVVYTEHSKIAGRIPASALKVGTTQFGEQPMKLTDVRTLSAPGAEPGATTAGSALENAPDSLMRLQGNIGKTYRFRVTANGNGSVWGSDVYTTDSSLETVAVHAGILKPGQTGIVKVTFVAPPPAFNGTTRNGVTTSPYLSFPGAFKVSK